MHLPKHYKDFVENFGGTTYGKPRFKLIWGSTPDGQFAIPDCFFFPYKDAWVLAEFRPPQDFGPKCDWDGAQFGEFPSGGGYVPLECFRHEIKGRKEPDMLDSEWLNKEVLGRIMFLHLRHEHDTMKQRLSVYKEAELAKEEEKVRVIADRLQDAFPQFGDACSFSGQANVNSALKQKMELIEKRMKFVRDFRKRIPHGRSIVPSGLIQPVGGGVLQ